jgi:beta-mannanase
MRPALRICVAAVLVVLCCGLPAAEAQAKARRVALGVNTTDAPDRAAAIDSFAARVGRSPAIVMWYQSWTEPLFYPSQMTTVASRHAVPLITWEPDGVPLRQIASGARDAYIRQAAVAARAWGRPFFVRFAHEMNGNWYSWGVRGNSSSDYVRAWRHVVRVFRQAGATNVRWVWSPNVTGYSAARFNRLFPGDRWVDWVGLDGYNWGAYKPSGWRSFRAVFSRSYARLARLTRKPMMIAEAGAPEQGGNKANWIRGGLLRELPRRMPRVRAVVWFDRKKEADWRVDSSRASLSAFRSAARSRLFSLGAHGLLAVKPVARHHHRSKRHRRG